MGATSPLRKLKVGGDHVLTAAENDAHNRIQLLIHYGFSKRLITSGGLSTEKERSVRIVFLYDLP